VEVTLIVSVFDDPRVHIVSPQELERICGKHLLQLRLPQDLSQSEWSHSGIEYAQLRRTGRVVDVENVVVFPTVWRGMIGGPGAGVV